MAKAQTTKETKKASKTDKTLKTGKDAKVTKGETYGKTGSKKRSPAATAAIYNPIGTMSAAARTAFPKADFVITVELPADNTTGPVLSVLAGPALKPVRTDLAGRTEIAAGNTTTVQLLPKAGELLQLIAPDGGATICVSRPRWLWIALPVTQL